MGRRLAVPVTERHTEQGAPPRRLARDARWDEQEAVEVLAPLAALRQTVRAAAALQPSAVLLPPSILPGLDAWGGLPVLRGDRAALVFEPPRYT